MENQFGALSEAQINELFEQASPAETVTKKTSVTPSEYAAMRQKEFLERKAPAVQEAFEADDDILMYGDTDPDKVDAEEKSFYTGDELESQKDKLMFLENSIEKGLKDGLWFAYDSLEGGNPTIAYGHKVTDKELASGVFDNGISQERAIELLEEDINEANVKARELVSDFDSFPFYLRQELVNSAFRGMLGKSPETVRLINEGKFDEAAVEYLRADDYYKAEDDPDTWGGLKQRMEDVSNALLQYSQELND
jgi:hypothetical protein